MDYSLLHDIRYCCARFSERTSICMLVWERLPPSITLTYASLKNNVKFTAPDGRFEPRRKAMPDSDNRVRPNTLVGNGPADIFYSFVMP